MLKIINKECLNNIQQETQDALLKFLKQNYCLKKDDVLLKAVANSQRLALHHTL